MQHGATAPNVSPGHDSGVLSLAGRLRGQAGRVALDAAAGTHVAPLDRNRARAKARGLARLLILAGGEAFGLDASAKAWFGDGNAE